MENFIGEIRMFAGNYAPVDWHLCDGTLLSIAENNTLFALLNTTYGGDGVTTFGLPDLRSRVPVHISTGQGLGTVIVGQAAGQEEVTLLPSNLPPHTHTLNAATVGGTVKTPSGNVIASTTKPGFATNANPPSTTLPTPVAMSPLSVMVNGGSLPVSIVQPYTAVSFIIAIQGLYPSRN
jgi:microcystin-dependent protein